MSILLAALLFQSVIFAQDNLSNTSPNSAIKGKGDQTIVSEDVSKRGEYERHFKMANGKYIAETYTEPVNKPKNGQLVPIDNTLSKSTDNNGKSILKNKDGLMDVAFAQNPGGDLVSITKDTYSVTWSMKAKSNNANKNVLKNNGKGEGTSDSVTILPAVTGEVSSDNISTTDNAVIDNITTPGIDSTVSDVTSSTSPSSQAGDSTVSIMDDSTSSTADSSGGTNDSDTYITDNSDTIDLNPDASAQIILTDTSSLTDEQKMTAALTADSAVQYSNVLPNTDLFYNITPTMVKENIVLKDKSDVTSYDVEMKINGLTPSLQPDNSINLCGASGNVVFTVAAPFMYDSGIMSDTRNNSSYDIAVQLTQKSKSKLDITYTPSYDWLSSPDRVYPVTIDPSITQKGSNHDTQTQDTYAPQGDTAIHGTEPYLYVGVNCWSYVKFTLPTLGPTDLMSNARIFMYAAERLPVNVYPITSAWDSNTLKSTNSPGYGGILLTDSYPIQCGSPYTNYYQYLFDIDDLAAGWYSGTQPNQGILLTANADPGRWWWIASSAYGDAVLLPALQVTYYTSTDASPANGPYAIRNNWSGRYLDAAGGNAVNGTEVLHYTFNGGLNQQWYIQSLGSGEYYILSNIDRNYTLDIANGDLSPSKHLQIYQNHDGFNQRFRILKVDVDGTIVIVPSYTRSSVLDGDMTTGSMYVMNWRFLPGMSNQRWTLGRSLNTPQIGQETDAWCWVASSLMLAETYVPSTTKSQTDIVMNIKHRLTNPDTGLYEGGTPEEDASAVYYATDNTVSCSASYSTISETTLLSYLNIGNPVLISRGVYNSSGNRIGGHATVIYGYNMANGTYIYYIRDPWPVSGTPSSTNHAGQSYTRTYAELINGASSGVDNSRWDRTVVKI